MAASLLDLQENFRADKLTYPEAKAWVECKDQGFRDYLVATTGSAIVSWLASRKFDIVSRLFVTGGVSFYCGILSFRRSQTIFIDRILSLNGTWMQRELVASLLKRYQDNPKIMGQLSKYFYAEKVYGDSSDIPKLRWRSRNFFEDGASTEATTVNDDSLGYNSDRMRKETKETTSAHKPAQMNTAVEVTEDPFECIFGTPAGIEEIHSSGMSNPRGAGRSNTTLKKHTHGSKRHHYRRHRKHHDEASEL